MGHYCKVCGRTRPNEKFSGKGHRNHICKECASIPADERPLQNMDDDEKLKIKAPLYLIGKKIECWRCAARMSVVAILAPKVEGTDNEICILTNIRHLPKDVIAYIQRRVPTFKLKYSKTEEEKYFANTCPKCGVLSGDFFLHLEPGAPFFPTEEDEARSLYLTEIPLSGHITVAASFSMGAGDMILECAKRIE